ncbi:helix-turn-helix transcriptional regulator [Azospirillum sp. A1-3]|uniref:helix-turn-helix transcriptional regulator n=1 Tax=Azospirillum sp. A1-3 TaxID=185874 RepID=UPI0020775EB8|nr:helix-turn-helix transcriptional regulator [Azospirillum sp. A1-3]MCM8735499.1 helix-turn-helix transcriptional regulator [Azospirillum sp. A1-3]
MTSDNQDAGGPPKTHKRRITKENTPPELLTFARNFKRARLEAGLSQNDITALTGIGQAYISVIENARHSPSLSYMALLARVVGKPLYELLEP